MYFLIYIIRYGGRGGGEGGGGGSAALVLYSMHAIICYNNAHHMFSYAVPGPPIPILLAIFELDSETDAAAASCVA